MLVFLFTDIEGSTRLWEEHTGAMTAVIARHDEILHELIEAHGGRITKHTGDGITAALDGGLPLTCALQAQVRFAAECQQDLHTAACPEPPSSRRRIDTTGPISTNAGFAMGSV